MSEAPLDLTGWARRDEEHRAACERLLVRLAAVEPELQRILAHYGVREAYLFGSAARGDVRPDSDVDLGVLGCTPALFYRLSVDLERALDLPLDLVDLDSAPEDMVQEIRRGRRIYPDSPGANHDQG